MRGRGRWRVAALTAALALCHVAAPSRDGGATFARCAVPGAPDLVTIWGSGPDDV